MCFDLLFNGRMSWLIHRWMLMFYATAVPLCKAPPSGPPLDVAITSHGKNWLRLSWKPPEPPFRNGKNLHYQVCSSTKSADTSPTCTNPVTLSRGYYYLLNLRPAAKYFVTVAAGTSAGYGVKSAEISGTTTEDRPSGPPLDLAAVTSRGKYGLRLSWKPPEQRLRNGRILHYRVCSSTRSADTSPTCIISVTLSRGYYYLQNLQPSTKYFVTVAAGTRVGYGVKSTEISVITNEARPTGPPLDVTITSRGKNWLRLSWKPPVQLFWNGKILHYRVCRSTKSAHTSPACTNSVTLSGGYYDLRQLRPSTKYFVTVAAGTSAGYGVKSSEINGTTNQASPSGPPLDLAIISRDKEWLILSWKPPAQRFRNGEILHNQVCRSTKSADTSPTCINSVRLSRGVYHLLNLRPSTKYFVTVAADTSAGYGVKSAEISGITNGEQVNPNSISFSTLQIKIEKPPEYIKEMMVIVQMGTRYSRTTEYIKTNELKSYQANTRDPYVTGYLKTDELPSDFVIGDGKQYNFGKRKYANKPLKQNSSYITFLRFFESEDSFYSTEWSKSIRTMEKPEVEYVCNQTPKISSDDQARRVDLLIPMIIVSVLSVCFLVSLGVIIYIHGRQRLQQVREQPSHEPKTSEQAGRLGPTQEPTNNYESIEGFQAAHEQCSYKSEAESAYATVDDVVESDERKLAGKSAPENSTEVECSSYMYLKENKEPVSFYQPLKSMDTKSREKKSVDQNDEYEMMSVDQTVKYENCKGT